MNKKTIAIAALALFATSGLASARTIHSPRREQTVQSETAAPSSYNAMNRYDEGAQRTYVEGGEPTQGAENQVFDHPGDNDMDRYHNNYDN